MSGVLIVRNDDRIIVGMIVHFGIAGQVGFGSGDFDVDLFVDLLYHFQIVGDGLFASIAIPLPAAVASLDIDAGLMDGEAIDEFEREMLVEDEDFG